MPIVSLLTAELHPCFALYGSKDTSLFDHWNEVSVVEFFTNYSYQVMSLGAGLIGIGAALMGCFLYLRKQSLLSDVVGHSALLGVMLAFIIATTVLNVDGRSMLVLTIGAIISATISVLLNEYINRTTKLSSDITMTVSLSLFYGLGIIALHYIVHSSLPNRGGIKSYMFGNAANITMGDIKVILVLILLVITVCTLGWKEIKVFIFDPILAHTLGFSKLILSPILLVCATISIVIGVKAVGLILMVAMAIMPAASARQWTNRLSSMVFLAVLMGGSCAVLGCLCSVKLGKVPTGPVIVLILFAVFLFSLLFAPQRSIIRRSLKRKQLQTQLRISAQTFTPDAVSACSPAYLRQTPSASTCATGNQSEAGKS